MKVIISKKAGFCMGVRRAVDLTLDLVNQRKDQIATFGPLIHNPQVLDVLQDKNVSVLKSIPEHGEGTIIIRAHGVPPQEKEQLKKAGFEVKDATCPRVLKVQAIIKKHKKEGMACVIIGDRNHAEVEGLMGYAGNNSFVVSNEDDAKSIEITKKYIIVSQTTQDEPSFIKLTRIITQRFPIGKIFNTICDSTHRRQREVRSLCNKVDAVVVVGGKNSANTTRLSEIARDMGRPVFLIESEDELDPKQLGDFDTIGVTAGASTPTWMINRVVRALESIPGKNSGYIWPRLLKIIRLLMVTNFYVSIAGAALTYGSCLLQDINPKIEYSLITFGYLFAMHNINRLSNHRAKIFNDPKYVSFYSRYKTVLLVISFSSLVMALGLSLSFGFKPFILLSIISLFGGLYSIHFIPTFLVNRIKVSRLKEIPGSKTLFVALAWALVTVLLPALSSNQVLNKMTLGCFIYILFFVFVRNALFDVFEVQGDRIVGKETLPVVIGAELTITALNFIMAILAIMLFSFPVFGLMSSSLSFWAIPGLLYLIVYTLLYQKNILGPGVRLEFGLETAFIVHFFFIFIGVSMNKF